MTSSKIKNDVSLAVFQKKDINEMARLANNINVARWVRSGFPHPYTRLDGEQFFNACKEEKKNTVYSIFWKGYFTGLLGLVHQKDDREIEIGYWIGEEYWGNGIATSALSVLIPDLLKKKKIERLTAEVMVSNTPSIKVLEKNSFKRYQEVHKVCNKYNSDPVYVYVLDRSA